MKNKLLGMLFSLLLILGVTQSAHSFPLMNWYFDIEGGGSDTLIVETMDIDSPNFVDTTFANPGDTSFTFTNYGFVESYGHDNKGSVVGYPGTKTVTGIYTLPGSGTLGGDVTFNNTGKFYMYVDAVLDYGTVTSSGDGSVGNPFVGPFFGADNGTHIATFDVISGSGQLNPVTGLPNGDFSISYKASYLAPGYFLMPTTKQDMSNFTDNVRGYTTTNASHMQTSSQGLSDSQAELLAYAGYTGTPANTPPVDFFLSSGGQFRIDVVPVPPAVLLLGSGVAALFGIRRKNS
jgi:hypothetical protein